MAHRQRRRYIRPRPMMPNLAIFSAYFAAQTIGAAYRGPDHGLRLCCHCCLRSPELFGAGLLVFVSSQLSIT
jgi:hypothetical protein